MAFGKEQVLVKNHAQVFFSEGPVRLNKNKVCTKIKYLMNAF